MSNDKTTFENNLVTKSNDLISASYKLKAVEKKIIALMASCISPNDKDFTTYTFRVSEISRLFNLSTNDYKFIKTTAYGLVGKKVKIYKADGVEAVVSWISSAVYTPRSGEIQLRFDPELKPYLINLKGAFTSYYLRNILKLKNGHSIHLYEMLKQYENTKHKTRSFKLDELKKKLGLNEHQYPTYAEFKRRILAPAQEELQKYTDINFTYKEEKTGRRVTGITFYLESQVLNDDIDIPKLKNIVNPIQIDEIDRLLRQQNIVIGQDAWKETSNKLKENFSRDEIAKIAVVLAKKTRERIISNPAGILIKNPVAIGRSIIEGTFYNDKRGSKVANNNEEYEIYVPPR